MQRRTSVHPPVRGLARQIGVGDERTRHPDCVGDSVRDEPVGRIRVDDARGRDQRRPDLERCRQPCYGALLDRRRRDDSRRAAIGGRVAEGDRDVIDDSGELGRDGHGGLGVGRKPDAERELGCRVPYCLHDRDEELRPRGPLVLAEVEPRGEELREEVAVGGRELDPVEPALGRELRGARVPGDELVDLGRGEGAGLDVEALARDRRRRDRGRPGRRGDQLAAAVKELDEETRPVRADGVDHAPVAGDDLGLVAGQGVGGQPPGLVDGGRLEDDHSRPARRARLVVGDELVRGQVVVDERGLVRGGDDPVRQLDGAEPQRAQEMLKHRRARARGRPAPRR